MVLPRDRHWYALCVACWRLAIPVVALSVDMPDKAAERERAERAARELRPKAAIVVGSVDEVLPSLPADCVVWQADAFWRQALSLPMLVENGVTSQVGADSVLLYCYTGGTTKHSKCVVVTHAMAIWEMETYEAATSSALQRRDRVLCYTSAFWGAACFGQVDIALAAGANCVFVPAEKGVDFIAKAVERFGITVLGTVPSQLRGAYPGGPESKPGCLRVILTWGEKLPVRLSRPWKSHCAVFELLIASEYWLALHTDCTTWRDPSDGQEKHVYKALPGLDMLLLADDGSRLPARGAEGQVGEFYLTGPTVSPGYLGADGRIGAGQENESSYVNLDGKIYFRSKDRLRITPGGGMVYSGRADSLAKRGGAWVDLEALEAAVGAVPGIASAVILAEDEVDVFVTLEPQHMLVEPSCRVMDRARRAGGGNCRVHVRSDLPLHPATAKVDRRRLRSQLAEAKARDVAHLARFAALHQRMLKGYVAWYPVAALMFCLPSLLVALVFHTPLYQVVFMLALRACIMPHLWAAMLHTVAAPPRDRSFYGWPLGPPDLVLMLTASLPAFLVCPAWACAVSILLRRRGSDVAEILVMASFAGVLVALAGTKGLNFDADSFSIVIDHVMLVLPVLVFLFLRRRLGLLGGLIVSFYLVLPKWLADDWTWRCRCDYSQFRRLLRSLLVAVPAKEWDGSLPWDYEMDEVGPTGYWARRENHSLVRVKPAARGAATHISFTQDLHPRGPVGYHQAGGSLPPTRPSTPQGAGGLSLEALVERSGGSTTALGALDSLQAITLAELIRKELGAVVSVAELLKCSDIEQLTAKVQAAAAAPPTSPCGKTCASNPEADQEYMDGLPDADGAYRAYTMVFNRMPVDWMVRYTGDGHLNLSALQRAVDRVVGRHSALRTVQSPDEPMRDMMDKVAATWQLWASVFGGRGDGRFWSLASSAVGQGIFECWPRSLLRSPLQARRKIRIPEKVEARHGDWDRVPDDEYVHSTVRQMQQDHRWPFDVFVIPLYKGTPPGAEGAQNAAEAAFMLPPESVSWYIYCGICHAYSDGASGQALMGDLIRFYNEEAGVEARVHRPESPEHMELLQRRLRKSLRGRAPGTVPDANNDVFHDVVCEDWGKRGGFSSMLYLQPRVIDTLRTAAFDVLGCGIDVAWLTAVMGAMFRLFPNEQRINLALKVACRDGPGEVQMVGFLSEQRLMSLDVLDPETGTLLDIAGGIGAARRSRAWRAPMPYEAGITVFVNIVSAMVDGLPDGFKHVVKPASAPNTWRGSAYCHLSVRIDQLSATEWDFRLFHWDASWGWSWIGCFADALGNTIADMAMSPTAPIHRPQDHCAAAARLASDAHARGGKRSIEALEPAAPADVAVDGGVEAALVEDAGSRPLKAARRNSQGNGISAGEGTAPSDAMEIR